MWNLSVPPSSVAGPSNGPACAYGRLQEHRDANASQHLNRDTLTPWRRDGRELFEEYAIGSFDVARWSRDGHPQFAPLTGLQRHQRREHDHVVRRRQLHLARGRLCPGMCGDLQPDGCGTVILHVRSALLDLADSMHARRIDRELGGVGGRCRQGQSDERRQEQAACHGHIYRAVPEFAIGGPWRDTVAGSAREQSFRPVRRPPDVRLEGDGRDDGVAVIAGRDVLPPCHAAVNGEVARRLGRGAVRHRIGRVPHHAVSGSGV